ncbi:MAG: hypothetical protein Q8S18_02645 [Bacteroidales bacterium]|nr:hypothetical protein [Bacteroidales bacterium]
MKLITYLAIAFLVAGSQHVVAQNSVTAPVQQKKPELQKKEGAQDKKVKTISGNETGAVKKVDGQSTGAVKSGTTITRSGNDKSQGQVISKSGQEGAVNASASTIDYLKKEVYPTMKSERTKLDKAMSADDKAKLNRLREDYKKLRGTSELFTEADLTTSPETMDKNKASQLGDIRRQVLAIGNNYPSQMKEYNEVINGKKDQWKAGLAQAAGTTAKTTGPSMVNVKGSPGAASDRNPIDVITNPFIFLLWDAEMPAGTKKGNRR